MLVVVVAAAAAAAVVRRDYSPSLIRHGWLFASQEAVEIERPLLEWMMGILFLGRALGGV